MPQETRRTDIPADRTASSNIGAVSGGNALCFISNTIDTNAQTPASSSDGRTSDVGTPGPNTLTTSEGLRTPRTALALVSSGMLAATAGDKAEIPDQSTPDVSTNDPEAPSSDADIEFGNDPGAEDGLDAEHAAQHGSSSSTDVNASYAADETDDDEAGDTDGARSASDAPALIAAAPRQPYTALQHFLPRESIPEPPASKPTAEAGETGATPTPHSVDGKAAQIQQCIAAGNDEEAMTLVHALVRRRARGRARAKAAGSRRPGDFLDKGWREQWSGQDVVAITQTLAKGTNKGDMSGKTVVDGWRERVFGILVKQPDLNLAADEIANMIFTKVSARNAADRRSLANSLTEVQVQVAELLQVDPREYVRPIHTSDAPMDNGIDSATPMLGESGEMSTRAPEGEVTP